MSTTYQFDYSGVLPQNKIINEPCYIVSPSGGNGFLIKPIAAPYFGDSLIVTNSNGDSLQENIDFYKTHHWQQATDAVGQDVYGTITVISDLAVGTLKLTYQTIGGSYVTAPAQTIANGIISVGNQYVLIDWSTAPTAFPPTPHTQDLNSFTGGIPQIEAGLFAIANALKIKPTGVSYDDLNGVNDIYINAILSPLIDIASSINTNNDAIGGTLTDILSQLSTSSETNNDFSNVDNFTLNWGKLKINIGYVNFPLFGEPSKVMFNSPFSKNNFIVLPLMTFRDSKDGFLYDTLNIGSPELDGFAVSINYNQNTANKARRISYLSIGI